MASPPDILFTTLAERYTIQRELGEGGMATVYLAHDLKHQRRVAIKVLKPELAALLGSERFLREIEIAARLNHPHILPLHDSGIADGLLYYVMPYVEGETLRGRLSRERLDVDEAVRLAKGLAEALDYTHRQGVVHRDLKPENILLHEHKALLADFGIALLSASAGKDRLTASGVAIGTPDYMSPEQASGQNVDERSDVYSFGCVLYEMLSGRPPARFGAGNPLKELSHIPPALGRLVHKCLRAEVQHRYASVREILDDLDVFENRNTVVHAGVGLLLRHRLVSTAGVSLFAIGALVTIELGSHSSRFRWARNDAPAIARALVDSGRVYQAYRVIQKAASIAPDDSILHDLLNEFTAPVTLTSSPAGAEFYARDFLADTTEWELVGRAPIKNLRMPVGTFVLKVQAPGFQTKELIAGTYRRAHNVSLTHAAAAPHDMVQIGGGPFDLYKANRVMLDEFWLDTYEVSNAHFKEFVDGGGYEREEFWSAALAAANRKLTFAAAQERFRDGVGRPGPATWELGTFPEGTAAHPVGGVSWYEAAAFCAAQKKQLPTVYHWYRAADFHPMTSFVVFSNFLSPAPQPVGRPLHLGTNGTYGMAGNVKEWAWNDAGSGLRYLLGGSWTEASYMTFWDHDAQLPENRNRTYGFRCAKYSRPPVPAAFDSIIRPVRDFRLEKPASDEVYKVLAGNYAYERSPVDGRVESTDTTPQRRIVERVSYDAVYGNERVPAFLFLPRNAKPPYQTVVWFPNAGPFLDTAAIQTPDGQHQLFDCLIASGRAVLFPVYKGTYQRTLGSVNDPDVYREAIVHAGKDLRRGLDYLATRRDIDTTRFAFMGFSMGAAMGPIMTAVEPRFRVSILLSGGMYAWKRAAETEAINFLPRVHSPTLMLNGKHDFFFPVETSQKPMLDLLGTKEKDKKRVEFPSGHIPQERQQVMKEVLNWLDQYLGRVPLVPAAKAAANRN